MREPGRVADAVINFEKAYISHSVIGSATTRPPGRRRKRRRQTGLLDEHDVKGAVAMYVSPACHAKAAAKLGVEHVVLLEGERGLGKQTAAIALLREKTPKPLRRLSPASTVKDLCEYRYQPGRGYLVADHVGAEGSRHADFDWHLVRDAVRRVGAFLVVTRRKPVVDVDSVKVVAWAWPPLEDVVRSHVGEAAAEVLAALPADCTMTEVAGVAARLADGEPVDEAVRGLGRTAAEVVRTWFEAGPGRQDLVEVTALAFGAGLTGEEFEARRTALDRHLPPGDRTSTATATRLVTGAPGTRAFADPRYGEHVLAELNARQSKSFWAGVVAWLAEIVETTGADVAVAFGLAQLSEVDLGTVETGCLDPWSAGALGWSGQTTAAFVVWAMALEERTRSAALGVVRGWAGGSAVQRQTAALALAGELGAQFPAEAVAELKKMVERGRSDDAVTDALGTLFGVLTAEKDGGGGLVLELLADLGRGPAPRDAVSRTTRAVLTAWNPEDDELALGALLREDPALAEAVGKVAAPLLADPRFRGDVLRATAAAAQNLKEGDLKEFVQALEGAAEPVATPDPEPPPPPIRADTGERGYPITGVIRVGERRRRRLPGLEPHEVLVFHTGDGCVADPGGRARARLLRRADVVTVVDRTVARFVPVVVPIPSAGPAPFHLVAGFACTATDPARVAREGVDAAGLIRGHLRRHHRLLELGRGCGPRETGQVRRDALARVRALLDVRPLDLPGVDVRLTSVDLFAPPSPAKEEDADH